MTNDRAAGIRGTITLPDGEQVQFSINYEDGYQQWGADPRTVGRTQPIVDAMTTALYGEELLDPGADAEDDNQDEIDRSIAEHERALAEQEDA